MKYALQIFDFEDQHRFVDVKGMSVFGWKSKGTKMSYIYKPLN